MVPAPAPPGHRRGEERSGGEVGWVALGLVGLG